MDPTRTDAGALTSRRSRSLCEHGPLSVELLRDEHAPSRARRMIAVWCGDWLSEQELADAKLVTSELVSNAVVHGVGHIRLTTHLDESRLLIEVLDDGTGFERSAPEAAIPVDRPGGRGLVVVDQIASRWGIHKGSARAWAELERAG